MGISEYLLITFTYVTNVIGDQITIAQHGYHLEYKDRMPPTNTNVAKSKILCNDDTNLSSFLCKMKFDI